MLKMGEGPYYGYPRSQGPRKVLPISGTFQDLYAGSNQRRSRRRIGQLIAPCFGTYRDKERGTAGPGPVRLVVIVSRRSCDVLPR